MGSAGGVRWLVMSLLPNCFWAFPGGKGITNSSAFIRIGTFVTVNHRSSKAFSFGDLYLLSHLLWLRSWKDDLCTRQKPFNV